MMMVRKDGHMQCQRSEMICIQFTGDRSFTQWVTTSRGRTCTLHQEASGEAIRCSRIVNAVGDLLSRFAHGACVLEQQLGSSILPVATNSKGLLTTLNMKIGLRGKLQKLDIAGDVASIELVIQYNY